MKIFGKEYWDWWLTKFFSFFVSVHMLIIAGLFYFLYRKWLGEVTFSICLPVVVTDRMLKDIKGINNNNHKNNNNDDKKAGKDLAKMIAKARSEGKE